MMFTPKIFAVLLIASNAFAGPVTDGQCKDDACWRDGIAKFLQEFAAGDASKGVTAFDPATVENINVPEEALGINSYFPELKITGLKNAIVADYSKDKNTENGVQIALKFDLVAEGPVSLQFPKKNKELKSTIKYEAAISSHIKYSIGNDQIGPETISCEASNAKYTISNDFIQVLENDPDASAVEPQYDNIHNDHVKKVACEIAEATLKLLVQDFRAIIASKP